MKTAFVLSIASLLMLLSGCQTAPTVCPSQPEPPAKVPLGESFQEQMQRFLSGLLDEPMSYELPSKGAKVGRNEGTRLDH